MDDSVEPNDQAGAAQPPHGGDRSAPRWRTRLAVGVAGVVGLATGIGFSAASTPAGLTRTGAPASTGGSNLYVVDGRTGSATPTGTDSWRLDLTGASVLWFRDRPYRGSGTESPASFVAGWSKTFAGSPPYAAVLAPNGPEGHHPTAVKLTDPTYDPATGTTSVTLTPDKGESVADAAWLSKLTPGAASTDGRVVLFVDDSSPVSYGPTPDDVNIVEYFNQIMFNAEIYVDVQDLGTQYQLVLSCPEPPSPTIPGPDFLLTMYTADSPPSSSTTCNGAPILLQKAVLPLPQSSFCASGGSNCNFNIVLSNRSSGTPSPTASSLGGSGGTRTGDHPSGAAAHSAQTPLNEKWWGSMRNPVSLRSRLRSGSKVESGISTTRLQTSQTRWWWTSSARCQRDGPWPRWTWNASSNRSSSSRVR